MSVRKPASLFDDDACRLAALVSAGGEADGVCMLTDVDGVFTKPPTEPGAERIKENRLIPRGSN